MRGTIVGPEIRLDLDDPPDPSPGLIVADESRAQQASGRLERGAGEERSVDDGQATGL